MASDFASASLLCTCHSKKLHAKGNNTFHQIKIMKKYNLNILTFLLFVPIFSIGQIPNGHFIDADSSAPRGKKIKPFIQKEKGIYHYAVLTELPFENDCIEITDEGERIKCSERNLRKLIFEKLEDIDFRGRVYAYLTIDNNQRIKDIYIYSYPKSEKVNERIEEAIKKLDVKSGIYEGQEVTSRLWTSFSFPSSFKESFQESLSKLKADTNPEYSRYENLLFDATEYILSGPIYPKGSEFQAATKIVGFWKNRDTGLNIPIGNEFYNILSNDNQQQYLYMISMMNYSLNQKLNYNKILPCKPIPGQIYSEQEDVKEVQLGGAKILLEFIGKKENNVPMNSKTKKYYKAYEKGELEEKLSK